MKRRSFIRNTVWGTAGIAVSARILSSCTGSGSIEKPVIAVIGCGARGIELALKVCRISANATIKYVCDVNMKRSSQLASEIQRSVGYLPVSVGHLQTALEDKEVNAVIIATPDHWHALATVLACQAGKDVYLEANPTHNVWEGEKIKEAAVRSKRIIQVGFQNRSSSSAVTAREYIQSGKLGQVVHVKVYNMAGGGKWVAREDSPVPEGLDWDAWLGPAAIRDYNPGIYEVTSQGGWNNYWSYGGGILAGATGHLLDLARMVLDDPGHPASVYCSGGNWCWGSLREVPENLAITYDYGKFALTCETGNAMGYMKDGTPSVTAGATGSSDWMRTSSRIEIYGTEGLMYLGLDEKGWQVTGKDGVLIAGEPGTNPDLAHLKDFIDCIKTRHNPKSDIDQSRLSAALIHLGNIAYRTGNKQLLFDASKGVFANNDQANSLLKTTYREGYVIPEKV
ncbi:MAG: Gfo/Idh/MocA family protein [Mangrovibacterium sp.]